MIYHLSVVLHDCIYVKWSVLICRWSCIW